MRVESAPSFILGSPLGELAAAGLTEGYFRVTLHITQKISQRIPPPSNDGSPPFSREAYIGLP